MESIEFIDLKKSTMWKGMSKNEIRIKLSGKDRHVSFNKRITKELKEKNYPYVKVGKGNQSNSVYFVFNHQGGYPVPDPQKYRVYIIRGKGIVDFLEEHFNLTGNSCELHISDNLAKVKDYSTYKISLPDESTLEVSED